MKTKLIHSLGPLFGLFLFLVALWVIHHELRAYNVHDILQHLRGLPSHRLFPALALTFTSYLVMTGYDTLALRYIRHPLPYSKTALASFIGYAFSNNIGLSMIAGATVRYRLYSAWGLSAVEITKVVIFCSLTFWLGFFALGGLTFLLEPMVIPEALHLPFNSARPLGMFLLALVVAYLLCSVLRKHPLIIREWEFPLPSTRLFFSQITVASLDWILAGSVLYALMPVMPTLSLPGFIGIYMLAQLAGLLSQVPGGLGVFETVVLLLLSPILPASEILGVLLAYRGMYYLLPLGVATVLLGAQELLRRKERFLSFVRISGQWISGVVPYVLSFTVFVGGALLLFSGATPAVSWRLIWLEEFLPLPVLEISHFLGSLVGIGLLLLARGLLRRLDAAYVLTVALLACGVVFSLLKGLDYEEAIALLVMLGALLPCRRHFYRNASLFSQRFDPAWIILIVTVLICSVWLGMFSYKHVEYSGDLWWRFTFSGNAPRFLRTMVGSIGIVLFLGLAKLLSPGSPKLSSTRDEDLNRIMAIVRTSYKTYANLALLGDKTFIFSQKGNAFIMYGIEGRSWVGMGDPIGKEEEYAELVWGFREMCDRYDGWPVFYEVGPENLYLYLDLGLTLLKLGEQGRVPLENFSLKGSARKGLRYTSHKLEREGCIFEVVPTEEVPSLLPELKRISDTWLAGKAAREKGFSLGFFDLDYLKRFPVGIVRKDGKLIAFANIWSGAGKEEVSIDLMRYVPEAPRDVMEYLFVELMLWGRQEKYRWFNLGMAPLSGIQDHALAPLWNRLGAFVFRHGEHFYNLQGLRRYKEKFDPVWEPRYLASPGGLALPRILANIASLISGGVKGVIGK
jgi:phosphatidylglycerol lysyltransferase